MLLFHPCAFWLWSQSAFCLGVAWSNAAVARSTRSKTFSSRIRRILFVYVQCCQDQSGWSLNSSVLEEHKGREEQRKHVYNTRKHDVNMEDSKVEDYAPSSRPIM